MDEQRQSDFDRIKRELAQKESLRKELLEAAINYWFESPTHSYQESARKFGINAMTLRNTIMRRYGTPKRPKDDKDTETTLRAITLQQP